MRTSLRRDGGPTGAVIAISGLDGAGKSTQGRALADALRASGYDPVVQWQRISYDRSLQWLTAPIRWVLKIVLRRRGQAPAPLPESDPLFVAPEHLATRALRERMPLVSAAWVTVVAVLHARSVRREMLREVRRGRVVVRDRYLLDSLVHLHDRYAGAHDVRLQEWLIRRLIPAPLVAYYLDVTAEEAWRRKPEEYTVADLDAHRRGYLRTADALGVRVLDGEQPAAQITAAIVGEVLQSLRDRPGDTGTSCLT